MQWIERVVIDDFWGDKTVDIKFKNDVNFIIGLNGTGKTTFINILAASLQGDILTLCEMQFSRIWIQMRKFAGRAKPSIEIVKISNDSPIEGKLKITVRESASSEKIDYFFDAFFEERHFRAFHRLRRHGMPAPGDLIERLSNLVNLSWLSIHRGSLLRRSDDEIDTISPVDKKVHEISQSFANYFSLLGAQAVDEQRKFLEKVFLSLLFDPERNINLDQIKNSDDDRDDLSRIFSEFGLKPSVFESRIKRHFDELKRKLDPTVADVAIRRLSDLAVLTDTARLHNLVMQWQLLQDKQEEIFKPRADFLAIINKMLSRKSLSFSNRNEPVVTTASGKKFQPKHLSSGEKQLYIFLGESLLQESKPCVFVADEPELSLHVTWQSQLVDSLRQLNNNSQIIFATHSPDIVSRYKDRVIEIEKAIS